MSIAILTKFVGPTNTRPARIKASCEKGSVTLSWEHGMSVEDNHKYAAILLADRVGLPTNAIASITGGSLPGSGFAFVVTVR